MKSGLAKAVGIAFTPWSNATLVSWSAGATHSIGNMSKQEYREVIYSRTAPRYTGVLQTHTASSAQT